MSLSIENLTVRFGATTAVDDLTLHLGDGERLALLGPSGCGKSTLLRVIAGLEPGAEGTVKLDGESLHGVDPHLRPLGLMFQDHALFPHRNVGENVAFGLRMLKLERQAIQARVAQMLEIVGLDGYGTRDVVTLSGGEAQRVALARALAPSPRVLLLDEPLGSLDRGLRDRLVDDLPDVLAETATSAIHVTHDHDEAFAIGDRVAVMHSGSIVQVGTPEQVWADPASSTVARFLGHGNLFENTGGIEMWRADAAYIDPQGELRGVVTRRLFRGQQYEVTVALNDGGDAKFWLADPPAMGEPVSLTLDRTKVRLLAD